MSEIDTLTIAQAREAMQRGKEIEKLMGGTSATPSAAADHSFERQQIVILDRGFVFVGNVKLHDGWCIISNAQNVRRWGTSKGLGELAEKGPLKDTVLDSAGIVRAPERAVIGLIECTAASWKK